jgi:hypothetical protein
VHRSEEEKLKLGYAPRTRVHAHGHRHVARVATILTALAMLIVAAMWGARWVRCVRVVNVERQCAAYRMQGQSVCEINNGEKTGWTTSLPPECWSRFYSLVSGGGFRTDGTAFLHERFTPLGKPRLIAVDVEVVQQTPDLSLSLHCRSYSRSHGFTLPQELSSTNWQGLGWFHNIKILGGKTDAANPSHFTIDMEIDGQPHTFDGWIRDTDENVQIQERASELPAPLKPKFISP